MSSQAIIAKDTVFSSWAFYSVNLGSILGFFYSTAGLYQSLNDPVALPTWLANWYRSWQHLMICIYGMTVSLALLALHQFYPAARNLGRGKKGTKIRALLYFLLSIPLHFTAFTRFYGWVLMTVSVLYLLGNRRGENGIVGQVSTMIQTKMWSKPDDEGGWWKSQRARGAVSRMAVLGIWLVVNCIFFYIRFMWAVGAVDHIAVNMDRSFCWAGRDEFFVHGCAEAASDYIKYLKFAKGFGFTLDLNCALIIVLIIQGVLKGMHEASNSTGWFYYLFGWMPVNKSLLFHKTIALSIFIGGLGHSFNHLMSHSYSLPIWNRENHFYNNIFGRIIGNVTIMDYSTVTLSIWVTGYMLAFIMVFMFALALEPVRQQRYEYFFIAHMSCNIIWALLLFWHSTVFWVYGGLPFFCYISDRFIRQGLSKKVRFALLRVHFSPPVMQLYFSIPWKYQAGQFAVLRCPAISRFETHPFTISSAYESNELSFHIKCFPGGWTEKVRDYLQYLVFEHCFPTGQGYFVNHDDKDPENKTWGFNFSTTGAAESKDLTGLVTYGKESHAGIPIMHIDGPHSAPAVHYKQYKIVVVSAAGIGLTPLNSICKTQTQYAWGTNLHKDQNPKDVAKTETMYAVWSCPLKDVGAYKWFFNSIAEIEESLKSLSSMDSSKHKPYFFEMHLFITSCPKDFEPIPWKNSTTLTYDKLVHAVNNPQEDASKFTPITRDYGISNRPNLLGNTHIWAGRPAWADILLRVRLRSEEPVHQTIGVFFCGPHPVALNISTLANKHSTKNTSFKVMKENF